MKSPLSLKLAALTLVSALALPASGLAQSLRIAYGANLRGETEPCG